MSVTSMLIDGERMISSEDLFGKDVLGACVLLERHTKYCICSYCQKAKNEKKYFVWIPQYKSRNSWRVIGWKKNEDNYYFRSTLPDPSRFFGFRFYKWNGGWRLYILPQIWCRINNLRGLISICSEQVYKTKIPHVESLFWMDMKVWKNCDEENCTQIKEKSK